MEKQHTKISKWKNYTITLRLLIVGLLTAILLIPLSFVKSLIHERMNRQQEVVDEISKKWGKEVLLYGPILKVPYKSTHKKEVYNPKTGIKQKELFNSIEYAYFFPNKLTIKSIINPQEKKRGIYKTAVYNSNISINGSFTKPDFSEKDIPSKNILWQKAKLIIKTTNLKGVNSLVEVTLNKNNYDFESKYEHKITNTYNTAIELHKLESNFIKKEDLPINKNVSFNLDISMNGSKQIRFIPIGKETNVQITSDWKTANFLGEFLPHNPNNISDEGFNAKWKILDINRPFSQKSFNGIPDLTNYAFGVNFMIPVDEYQKSERSVKYGFLIIGLTFLIFFLIQTLSNIKIHPFQYLMIGVALIMFYTLLIAISEHSSYLKAYLIAGTSVVVLISLYSKSILKNIKFPIFIGSSLTVLYTFIFVIIQLENFALLVGSIGLFIILASVMYASRKIDWQNE